MADNKTLRVLQKIREEMETLPGHLGMFYKDLITGFEFGVHEDEAFLAASVIKFPLYLHVLEQIENGKIDPTMKLTVTEEEKVPSCGALTLFTGSVDVDIPTLCRLMIDISDNTATNKLIRFCTIDGANEAFRKMGLEKTVLRRELFDSESSKRGIENTVCPKEIGSLLEMLYSKTYVNSKVCDEALDTLLKQQVDHKLNGKLCDRVPIAHKTGEDTNLSNDVGIVYAKRPFVLCFMGHDTEVYPWEDLIRRAAYDLVMVQEEE